MQKQVNNAENVEVPATKPTPAPPLSQNAATAKKTTKPGTTTAQSELRKSKGSMSCAKIIQLQVNPSQHQHQPRRR
jgi:hypothetical protein